MVALTLAIRFLSINEQDFGIDRGPYTTKIKISDTTS